MDGLHDCLAADYCAMTPDGRGRMTGGRSPCIPKLPRDPVSCKQLENVMPLVSRAS